MKIWAPLEVSHARHLVIHEAASAAKTESDPTVISIIQQPMIHTIHQTTMCLQKKIPVYILYIKTTSVINSACTMYTMFTILANCLYPRNFAFEMKVIVIQNHSWEKESMYLMFTTTCLHPLYDDNQCDTWLTRQQFMYNAHNVYNIANCLYSRHFTIQNAGNCNSEPFTRQQ